jgi:far upstream element-binding protein
MDTPRKGELAEEEKDAVGTPAATPATCAPSVGTPASFGDVAATPTSGGVAETPSSQAISSSEAPSLPSGLPPGMSAATAAAVEAGNMTTNPSAVIVSASGLSGAPNPEAVVEEKGEVSALYVGRVIGKGGEMIRDLQARSGCRIDVDQNVPPGQPRLITYRGTRKTVEFAKQLVRMLCQENVNEADLPLGDAKREYLVVPATSVGKIIGRGGEMIRELQSRSHAKIQVDHTGSSGIDVNEKQVTITGTEHLLSRRKKWSCSSWQIQQWMPCSRLICS